MIAVTADCKVNANVTLLGFSINASGDTARHSVATEDETELSKRLQQGVDKADCYAFKANIIKSVKTT